jgi:hypothetical protein
MALSQNKDKFQDIGSYDRVSGQIFMLCNTLPVPMERFPQAVDCSSPEKRAPVSSVITWYL